MVSAGRPWDHREIGKHMDAPPTPSPAPPAGGPANGGPGWRSPRTDGPFGERVPLADPRWVGGRRRGAAACWPTTRHGRGSGARAPLRRSRDDRLFGGVAGGVARRLGLDAGLVRLAFVVLSLTGGLGATAYVIGWLLLPLDGEEASVGARVARDGQGILLSLAFLPALVVTLVLGSVLHLGPVTSLAWPVFLCAAGAVLVWRNCGPDEREWLRQAAQPVVALGSGSRRSWRLLALRAALGLVLVCVGVALLAGQHPQAGTVVRPFAGTLLVVVAVVVVFGPWWLRLLRDLVDERQARARAEDRADMAARVHDSVLQTLALIQRSADQPQRVVQLARAQERELRSWLFDGDLPGAMPDAVGSVAAGARQVGQEVETAHGVPVDVVTVGDCPLDDRLHALLAAAREATVNAAKWSGAPMISLFCEVEADRVSIFVRDRGRGFALETVAPDRRGVSESIRGRMQRHGGTAVLRTAPGEGTEVELSMSSAPTR